MYKLPRVTHSKNTLVNSGLAYAYILPSKSNQQVQQMGWMLSNKSINDSESIVGRTIHHLYDQVCGTCLL